MIKNYIISSLRFFRKNLRYTLINTFGLTLGFTSSLLIFLFVDHEFSFDQFHENKERVYRVNFSYQDNSGNITKLVNSPPAFGAGALDQFPELSKISKLRYTMNCLLSNEGIQFYENKGYYADSLFLEILRFNLSSGDPTTALDYPNSIVITEAFALKYFNDSNPIGSTLLFNNSTPLKVTGVFSEVPSNSHLDFDFLISFSSYTVPEGYASDLSSWTWLGFLTYIELKPNTDPQQFEDKLVRFFRELHPANPNPPLPFIQNLSEVYLGSLGMADDLASNIRVGNQSGLNTLMVVALMILLLAGFNFSNLTSALLLTRTKSTGIRKVLGASKAGILSQALSESMLFVFFCAIISLGLIIVLFPTFSELLNWGFNLELDVVWKMIFVSVITGAVVSFLSFIFQLPGLARFEIIRSLKGSSQVRSRNPFQVRNMIVIMQFAMSIGLISATIIMTQQIDYLKNKDTGYNAENVVLIKMLPEDMSRYFDAFSEQLMNQTSVINVSRSERIVGDPWPWSITRRVDQDPEDSKRVFFNQVDYGYFETMGIPFDDGRTFSRDHVNDPTRSIIINKHAADYLGLDDPVGQQVHFFNQDGPRNIIGVVEDFSYTSLHEEIGPAVVVLPFIDLEYMYVRFAPGNPKKNIETLEAMWGTLSNSIPLDWKFLDDDLNQLYHSEENLSHMIKALSLLAIVLACLGLYGMITLIINQRIKEIGVRKVLGAPTISLYGLLVNSYIYQIFFAMILVLPLAHIYLQDWLEGFAYHIQISWWVYPSAAILLIFMILISITYEVLRAARVNPTLLLRDE